MYEDVLKFRKLCGVLKSEKKYSVKQIIAETGLSEPTVSKLLKDNPAELKIRPSVLGTVQDFIKKHISDLNYAGIRPDPREVERMRKNLSDYSADSSKKENETPEPGPEPGSQIIDLLKQLSKLVPSNVQIIINPK